MRNYKVLLNSKMKKDDQLIKNINNQFLRLMMNTAKNIKIYSIDSVKLCPI